MLQTISYVLMYRNGTQSKPVQYEYRFDSMQKLETLTDYIKRVADAKDVFWTYKIRRNGKKIH